ncbi:hypothetical protein FDP41_001115 [Naegleria fowleri]|uniref:Aminopeptidase n=1 Tax=Naegleria fowleri TaxID=5763 RepID=A0A6A5BZK6_NAEFO|nr:uncharacterized protein FDP41_001115 [Naegleria fowleri]KAF0979962.1 hypothetical protein FDP41_001115 [Naegleria fowleri]
MCQLHTTESSSRSAHAACSTSDRVLLPTDVRPINYRLTLNPDLEKFVFTVDEQVDLKIQKDPSSITKIVANSKEIVVNEASLSIGETTLEFKSITYDEANDYVIFELDNTNAAFSSLKIGDIVTLNIKSTGELNDRLVGFYRSKYYKDGVEKYGCCTQFEAVDARRCFVCWDEPSLKAVFEVTLIAPKTYVALSNMHCIEERDFGQDKKLCKFAPTPIMSTYLLAFVVYEFDYVEMIATETHNKIPVRVYTPVGKKEQGEFALQVAAKVLALYEKYFEIPYPLTKLDMAGVSLAAGAMENYGLVLYRENAIYVDPKNTSSSVKQYVAIVVAHELSHQWFGNLVTMAWWNSLFLNEAYATWCEYYATNQLFPEWLVWEQFVHDDFFKAMSLDSLKSSHPVEVPVRVAAEIDEIFDAISYSKGCCVVRMLINFLGEENFRKGMVHYLKKYSYSNADTIDLWDALTQATGIDVTSLMESWVLKIGFPVITVTEKINGNEKVLTLRQGRFLEESGVDTSDTTIWSIPVSYIVCSAEDKITENQFLMKEKETTLSIPSNSKWIKFNKNQTAFFRLNYQSDDYYASLVEPIRNKTLSAIDRMSVIEDACTLSKSGLTSTEGVFTLISAYSNEDNYTVVSSLATCFSTLFNIYKHEENIMKKFNKLAISTFSGIASKLGWTPKENESHLDSMLRPIVLNALIKYGDESTIEKATCLFDQYRNDPNSVIADLRGVAYHAAAKYGGQARYDQLLDIIQKTELFEEKIRVLRALGASSDSTLISKTLGMVLDGSVRSQDVIYLLSGVSANPKATTLAWKFLIDNFETIKEKFEGSFLPGRIVKLCTETVTDPKDVETLKTTLEPLKFKGIERSVDQSMEAISINSKWLQRSKDSILKWLNTNVE